jgi:hypothetical protein
VLLCNLCFGNEGISNPAAGFPARSDHQANALTNHEVGVVEGMVLSNAWVDSASANHDVLCCSSGKLKGATDGEK